MRKLTALALALLMLTGMTSAVATETVDISEPMDIEIMAYFVMDVTNEDPIIRYLSEKFNVNFKFTITNIDNYDDTLNMRIVSGDVPDWFRIRDTAQSVYTQLQQDGMLLNVSALVEKYGFENIRATFALPKCRSAGNRRRILPCARYAGKAVPRRLLPPGLVGGARAEDAGEFR